MGADEDAARSADGSGGAAREAGAAADEGDITE
jgi:hypothetical protein